MNSQKLEILLQAGNQSPDIFKETVYWAKYKQELLNQVSKMDIDYLRSGAYPRFASFGFNEFFPKRSFYNRLKDVVKVILYYLFSNKTYFSNVLTPYGLTLNDIHEMAYHHCQLRGKLTNSKGIDQLEASKFGHPADLFEIDTKAYTMAFLEYYIRYCFVNKNLSFKGDEIIVELGSGSGHQIEVLKKIHPDLTILCFDLPIPLFLCEEYLTNVFGKDKIVSVERTISWKNLESIEKGKIHFFGNWQFSVLKDFRFDLFWNAASFGEMEHQIVQNYLSYILGNADWIFLLQIRRGKSGVQKKIKFDDYINWLAGYKLMNEQDAYQPHKKLVEESEYFQALWKR